jgi:hypothetical protein
VNYLAHAQLIACTVAPAPRAASAIPVRASPARPTSSRSGRCEPGRLAIAKVAALPSPPVGPVINTVPTVPERVVVIALPP